MPLEAVKPPRGPMPRLHDYCRQEKRKLRHYEWVESNREKVNAYNRDWMRRARCTA
jgi:hypothetical protein